MAHERFFPDLGLRTGELAGSITPKNFPNIDVEAVKVKAVISNAGNVYVGRGGVRAVTATDREDVGYELPAGDETPWLFISNLDELFIIGDNAGDDVTYIALT